jgi:hypothetical protein
MTITAAASESKNADALKTIRVATSIRSGCTNSATNTALRSASATTAR